MQSNYANSFEKVSKKNSRQEQHREFKQGNPHRQKRRAKRQARYED